MTKSSFILPVIVACSFFASTSFGAKNTALKVVAKGNSAFALDLYSQLRTAEGNLFFSPYSISTALAMTQGGARGGTAQQMATTLHLTPSPHPDFAKLQKRLNEVQEKGQVKLAVANSIFPHVKYRFRPEYIGLVKENYGSEVTPLDYASDTEGARQSINQWVEKQTNAKIKDLIKPGLLDSLTRMVLANAIYFKGNWASQFKPKFTREQAFRVTTAKSVKTPMMYQQAEYGYMADREVQVLEMPYVGGEVTMCVLLPRQVDGLAALEKNLTAERLNRWLGSVRKQKVMVTLPKFKMTAEFNLGDALKKLGMTDAFSQGKADFSGMDGTRNLYIYAVVHKAFVDVNEEGTEAAAATGVVIRTRSAPRYPRFRADHPFLFLIRDKATGSILFLGRYSTPEK